MSVHNEPNTVNADTHKGTIHFNFNIFYAKDYMYNIHTGWFDWSALKMKYEEKYLNWSANCSSRKVLSVNPQFTEKNLSV